MIQVFFSPPFRLASLLALASLFASTGCASPAPSVAALVIDAPGASGEGYGDPALAVNGIRGGGERAQSLDVYSVPPREHLVLGWDGQRLVDGPGPDLVVFENPFDYGDTGARFMDPTVVEVSADGETWVAFPFDYVADDESTYSPQPESWSGFAGITPVRLNEDTLPLDPFDDGAGGDRFDLAALPDDVRQAGVRFVRLSAATRWTNPDTDAPFPRDPVSDGIDIDGIAGRTLVDDAP